jgi:predicted phage terminase large subunit-like protein
MYVLNYYRQHLDFPATIKQVEAQAAAWKPERIAIESVGYQRVLAQALQPGLLPIVQVQQPKQKEVRILGTLSPYFENGTLLINKNMEELLLEYLQFPKSEHDDILDALEMAVSQVAHRGVITLVGARRSW